MKKMRERAAPYIRPCGEFLNHVFIGIGQGVIVMGVFYLILLLLKWLL